MTRKVLFLKKEEKGWWKGTRGLEGGAQVTILELALETSSSRSSPTPAPILLTLFGEWFIPLGKVWGHSSLLHTEGSAYFCIISTPSTCQPQQPDNPHISQLNHHKANRESKPRFKSALQRITEPERALRTDRAATQRRLGAEQNTKYKMLCIYWQQPD